MPRYSVALETGLERTVIRLSGASINVTPSAVISCPYTGILRTFQAASQAVVMTSLAVMQSVVTVPSWCQADSLAEAKAVSPFARRSSSCATAMAPFRGWIWKGRRRNDARGGRRGAGGGAGRWWLALRGLAVVVVGRAVVGGADRDEQPVEALGLHADRRVPVAVHANLCGGVAGRGEQLGGEGRVQGDAGGWSAHVADRQVKGQPRRGAVGAVDGDSDGEGARCRGDLEAYRLAAFGHRVCPGARLGHRARVDAEVQVSLGGPLEEMLQVR